MATKDGLLALLEHSRGQVVSGEAAAGALGVSRAAVWKAAQALRAQGHQLEALPGAGYRLCPGSDALDAAALRAVLGQNAPPVRCFEETDSTNLQAKLWAVAGAPHGALVLAAAQTAGRGRLGRGFESPPGGLYMSVVLRPKDGTGAGLVTSAAAVAVCRAVQALCGLSLSIKWVNDLYYGGKKCCGILTEAGTGFESGSVEYLVVGIGLNYTTPAGAFGAEGAGVASSLFPGGGAPVPRARLAAAMHAGLLALFDDLPAHDFLDEYRARSLVLGRQIQVLATPPYAAVAEAIDDEAGLVVRPAGSEAHTLRYGEISVRL